MSYSSSRSTAVGSEDETPKEYSRGASVNAPTCVPMKAVSAEINKEELERVIVSRAVAEANAALRVESEWWAKELVRAVTESAKCSARAEKLEVRLDSLTKDMEKMSSSGAHAGAGVSKASSTEVAHMMKGLAESVLALEGSVNSLRETVRETREMACESREMAIETREKVFSEPQWNGYPSHVDERLLALQVQADNLQTQLDDERSKVEDLKQDLSFERQARRDEHRHVVEKIARNRDLRDLDTSSSTHGSSTPIAPFEGSRTPPLQRSPLASASARSVSTVASQSATSNHGGKFALAAASVKAAVSGVGLSTTQTSIGSSQSLHTLQTTSIATASALAALGRVAEAERCEGDFIDELADSGSFASLTWRSAASRGQSSSTHLSQGMPAQEASGVLMPMLSEVSVGLGDWQAAKAPKKDNSDRHRALYTKMENGLQNLLHRLDSSRLGESSRLCGDRKFSESVAGTGAIADCAQNVGSMQSVRPMACNGSESSLHSRMPESTSHASPQAMGHGAPAGRAAEVRDPPAPAKQPAGPPSHAPDSPSAAAAHTSKPTSAVSSRPTSADAHGGSMRRSDIVSPGPVLRGPPPPWLVPRASGPASTVRGGSAPPVQVSARAGSAGPFGSQGDDRD